MVFHVGTSKSMFVDVDRYLSIFTEFGIFTHFVIHKAELATCIEQNKVTMSVVLSTNSQFYAKMG